MSSQQPNMAMNQNPMMMSGSALPSVQPSAPFRPAEGPQVVASPEAPKKGGKGWIWVVAAVVAAGAGYWAWQNQQQKAGQATVVAVRTATVAAGKVEKTLRLTGSTTAEKYISLIAPSLRGGRVSGGGGGGGGGDRGSRGGGGGGQVSSNSGGGGGTSSSSSSSTAAASSTLSSTSLGNMVASSSGAAGGGGAGGTQFSGDSLASTSGGGGANLRSARSASGGGGGSTRSSTASRGGSSKAAVSASAGADGLGSTAGQLNGGGTPGGGGGGPSGSSGGRGGDFSLQIQQLAPNGIKVKKGDAIAEFDRQYMLLRLDDYKANVEQSENSMKASMATLEVTRKSYEQQILAAKNAVAKAELDMRTIPVRSAIDAERLKLAMEETKANLQQLQEAAKYVDIGERATLKGSELELSASKLELRRAGVNADRMVIKAPMDGLVVMQNTFRGSDFGAIQQGDQVFPGQMFMQVVDPSSMIISSTVNQVDVQNLKLGQKAKVRFDAFPGLELRARLVMIGAITKTAGTRGSYKKDVPVRLKLEEMDPRVIPDLSVSADIILDQAETSALVPAEAIMTAAAAAGAEDKPFVMVRNGANGWEKRPVEIGVVSFTHVAVRSGLKPGDVVALEPPPAPPEKSGASKS